MCECRKCNKRVTRRNFGSGGGYGTLFGRYGYVRCKDCTRKMLRGATSVGTLDTRTGEIKVIR